MGRLIEETKVLEVMKLHWLSGTVAHHVIDEIRTDIIKYVPTVEAIPKSDYENRLKADMVAMLTELQLEIEEIDSRAGYDGNGMPTFANDYIRIKKVNDIIQQKIDKLKENKNG